MPGRDATLTTRSLPPTYVPGEEFTVELSVDLSSLQNPTGFVVVEMLPPGVTVLSADHPEVFAAICANVPTPIVDSTWIPARYAPYTGPEGTMTSDGVALIDRLNGALWLDTARDTSLPFMMVVTITRLE